MTFHVLEEISCLYSDFDFSL